MGPDRHLSYSEWHPGAAGSHRTIWVIIQLSSSVTDFKQCRSNQPGARLWLNSAGGRGSGTRSWNRDPVSSRRSLPLEEPPFITSAPGNAKDGGVTSDWPAVCRCHGKHPWGQWKQMTGTIIWGIITKVSCLIHASLQITSPSCLNKPI